MFVISGDINICPVTVYILIYPRYQTVYKLLVIYMIDMDMYLTLVNK